MIILLSVYQLTHTEQTASLVVAMRLFECLSVSRRESRQGLSQYVPTPSESLSAHLSRCTRPCPGLLGRTSSIPVSCGASGPCACHPVGGHAGIAINSSKRTATIPHFTYCTTCRTTERGFAQNCRGQGFGGSSNIKFYVFMYDIDRVIGRFSDPQ